MLFNPLALVFAPEHDGVARFGGLHSSGFELRYFSTQESLYAEVQSLADVRGVAVLLMGSPAENRNAIYYLRTIQARLGVIAQLRTGSEEEQMALIQAGVDWTCPVGASNELMATLLLSLWHRRMSRRSLSRSAYPAAQREHGGWTLADHAWTLVCPSGVRVGLTSSERALLSALIESEDLSASHDALIAAVNYARNLPQESGPRTRLGVLVSRLRSKCRRQGVDLPVRVMHNQGYMLAAQEPPIPPSAAPSQG